MDVTENPCCLVVWLVTTNVRFGTGFKRTSSKWKKSIMIIFMAKICDDNIRGNFLELLKEQEK